VVKEHTYIRSLDGLRAYAALSVLAFHAASIWLFSLGWVGVHVFFILSGFLITWILLNTKEATNFYSSFYLRRTLRIFPIYYFVLLLVLVIAVYCNNAIADFWYFFFYLQNFKLAANEFTVNFPSYYHTWSLAIEEQFYLFFPFVVRNLGRQSLKYFLITMIFCSMAVRFTLVYFYSGSALVWANTISNIDFLLSGALLAYFYRVTESQRIRQSLVFILSGTVILYLGFAFLTSFANAFTGISLTQANGQFFLMVLIPAILLLIHALLNHNSRFFRLAFENNVIVYLGKISYGLYLFHFPVFYLVESLLPRNQFVFRTELQRTLTIMPLKFALTIALASLSWRYFEKRILEQKRRFAYRYQIIEHENSIIRR
jgi:peptidoglycan/LPS O-acetylase OafA/YrhL